MLVFCEYATYSNNHSFQIVAFVSPLQHQICNANASQARNGASKSSLGITSSKE